MSFVSQPAYDVYENQFIHFFLSKLLRRIEFLAAIIERTIQDREALIRHETRYQTSARLPQLREDLRTARELRSKFSDLTSMVRKLSQLDCLRTVAFDESQFRLTYSLKLTQDFNYSQVFRLYLDLIQDERINRLDWQISYADRLFSLGMKATSDLYEYWVFVALYKQLLQMHFTPEDLSDLRDVITNNTLDARLAQGASVTLVGDPRIYENCSVTLYYDRSFYRGLGPERGTRPDVTMQVRIRGQRDKYIAFDAKYKDYQGGSGMNTREAFGKDLEQCMLYLEKVPSCIAAFIIHVSPYPDMKNYGAVREIHGIRTANQHRSGYIPVAPGPGGSRINLQLLLGMIFMVKLQTGLDLCWSCGSDKVGSKIRKTSDGKVQYDHRVCDVCENEWWLNHCTCGFPLIKGTLSFQVMHDDCSWGAGYYFCPGCGKCLCGVGVGQASKLQ